MAPSRSGTLLTLAFASLAAPLQAFAAERQTLHIALQVVGACELHAAVAVAAASCGRSQPLAVARAGAGAIAETAALTPPSPQFAAPETGGGERRAARFTTFAF